MEEPTKGCLEFIVDRNSIGHCIAIVISSRRREILRLYVDENARSVADFGDDYAHDSRMRHSLSRAKMFGRPLLVSDNYEPPSACHSISAIALAMAP